MSGSKRGVPAVALVILAAVLLAGCGRVAVAPPGSVEEPNLIVDPGEEVPHNALYRAEIAEVLAGNSDGLVVVRMWAAAGVPAADVCILEPAENEVRARITPAPGAAITKVALDREWVAWVERTGDDWTLRAGRIDALPGTADVIDSGRYTPRTGPDFPTPSLDAGRLAYDRSVDTGEIMDSHIVLGDLGTGTWQVISSLTATDAYLGPPSLSGNMLAWHLGEWTADMRATVYIHDIAAGTTASLPGTEGRAMMVPVVANNYLA